MRDATRMNHRVAHRSAGTAPDRPTLGTATRWTRHGRPGQHDIPLSPLQPAGPARGGRDAGCPVRWTAIAGPSGVGKTTLLSLTASVRQPTTGTVRWVTETGVSPAHLGGCAWIGQQTVLLPGTISDNIRI